MDRPEYLSEGEFDASVAKVCAGAEKPPIIQATPFAWIDPPEIPRRRWLYGRHYVRKFVSETVAIGGVGKSSLALAESLAMVTGCNLLGIVPEERVNVWLWNGEDPADELHRRIAAAAIHYGITPSEIEGRLFVDSGRETKIILAEQTRTGAVIARPVVDAVIATIKANEIDLMIVDPFVASHRVIENDNPAIELVAAAWAEIADVTGCAIELGACLLNPGEMGFEPLKPVGEPDAANLRIRFDVRVEALRASFVAPFPRWRSSAGCECGQGRGPPLGELQDIVGEADEAPLVGDLLDAAQEKLTEAARLLDLSEHRLGQLLS